MLTSLISLYNFSQRELVVLLGDREAERFMNGLKVNIDIDVAIQNIRASLDYPCLKHGCRACFRFGLGVVEPLRVDVHTDECTSHRAKS